MKEILGELCRKAHQAKGTDSYYPLVAQAELAIKKAVREKILEKMPKKKLFHEGKCFYLNNKKATVDTCSCGRWHFNQALTEAIKVIDSVLGDPK